MTTYGNLADTERTEAAMDAFYTRPRQNRLDLAAQQIVQVGYEISDCNDERWTDFDEAVRIHCERNPKDSDMVTAYMQEIEAAFRTEFPQGKAR